ncbi:hypothetical protein TWF191_010754 [Orbilia oligospora]|uniref:Uncharacterized protein n=1 Tax=Orbilia oligospora TaxID=2813651 RepID=A0A7C8UTI8_ORBOL|nr:hypothetical protein TWF191_010754 [Orbilia oligospora]
MLFDRMDIAFDSWGPARLPARNYWQLYPLEGQKTLTPLTTQQPAWFQICPCCENHKLIPVEVPVISDRGNTGTGIGIGTATGTASGTGNESAEPTRSRSSSTLSQASSYLSCMWRTVPRSSSVNPVIDLSSTTSDSGWSQIAATPEQTSLALDPLYLGSNTRDRRLPETQMHAGPETSEPPGTDRAKRVPAIHVNALTPQTSPASSAGAPVIPHLQPLSTAGWTVPAEWLVSGEQIRRSNSVIGMSGEFGSDGSRYINGEAYELDVINISSRDEGSTEFRFPMPPTRTWIQPLPGSLGNFVRNNPPILQRRRNPFSVSSEPSGLQRHGTAGTDQPARITSDSQAAPPHAL